MSLMMAFFLLGAAAVVVHLGAFPSLVRYRGRIAASILALVLCDVVLHWVVAHRHAGEVPAVVASVVVIALSMASVPIAILVLASWGWAQRAKGKRASDGDDEEETKRGDAEPSRSRRQLLEGAGSAVILGATGSTLAWGALRGRYDFKLEEVPVRIAGLPRALDGYVIAQVSDLHVGLHVGERVIDEGLELVRRAKPDLLVATGDLVDFDPSFAPLVARKLADVAPRDGVFAILGNHDHYAGGEAVAAALRAGSVVPLVNEGRVVRPRDGGGFALLGVEDLWARRGHRKGPDLDRALADVPEHLPRILLSHQPWTVDEWAGRVALQLSGHTHGGQINPGFTVARLFFPYVSGMYAVKGTSLYVNRGFGTVGPPARVGAPPEVTRFVLIAA